MSENIQLQAIVDFFVKAGKLDTASTAAFEKEKDKLLGALISKMQVPAATVNIPINPKLTKITPAQLVLLKHQLEEQISVLSKVKGLDLRDLKKNQAAQIFLSNALESLNKASAFNPKLKQSKQTIKDFEALATDQNHLFEILGRKDSAKHLQNLRVYTQHLEDSYSELSKIHALASKGQRVLVGKGRRKVPIDVLKSSIPEFKTAADQAKAAVSVISKLVTVQGVEKALTKQMAALEKEAYQEKADREKAAKKQYELDKAQTIANEDNRKRDEAIRKRNEKTAAKLSTDSSKETFRTRRIARQNEKKAAAQDLKEQTDNSKEVFRVRQHVKKYEEKQAVIAAERDRAARGEEAIARVGGIEKSNLSQLQPHEQDYVRSSLRARERNIATRQDAITRQLDSPNLAADAVAHLNREHAQLSAQLPHIRSGLNYVGQEMRGVTGFTHQAAIATQQFLRYAVLYGAGYRALSGVGNLFGGALDLDKSLHAIKAISQASSEAMISIESAIKGVATASQFSVGEVADAAQVLAQAGVELDKLPGILDVTAKLASTTGADLKSTADVLTSLAEVYEKTSTVEVTALADQIAQAVNISKLTTEGVKTIISLGASTAHLSGINSDQFLGASATLRNRGIKDSTVATGLRETMLELFNPDEKMLSYLKLRYARIGEDVQESFIKAQFQAFQHSENPLLAALTELKRVGVAGAGRQDFNRVTDIRAQQILIPLLDNLNELASNTAKINQSGAISRGAATQMEAFNNALTSLGSTMVSLTHELISGVLPALTSTTNSLKSAADFLRHLAIDAEGNKAGSTGSSLSAGLLAGTLAGLRSGGSAFKRIATGTAVATGVGIGDAGLHAAADNTGGATNVLASAGEIALNVFGVVALIKKIQRLFGAARIAEAAVPATAAVEAAGIGTFLGRIGVFLTAPLWAEWGLIVAGLTTAAAGIYSQVSGSDSKAAIRAAITKQTEAQKKKDEVDTQFAPFSRATAGGQGEAVYKAGLHFDTAVDKVKQLTGFNPSDTLIDQLKKLGTDGVEAGSKPQLEILDKLKGTFDITNKATVKTLTELGTQLATASNELSGKVQQQQEELIFILGQDDAVLTDVQRVTKQVFLKQTPAMRALLTRMEGTNSASGFKKVQSALSQFLETIYVFAPDQTKNDLEQSKQQVISAILHSQTANPEQLTAAVLAIQEEIDKGSVSYLEMVASQIAEAFNTAKTGRGGISPVNHAALNTINDLVTAGLPVAQANADKAANTKAADLKTKAELEAEEKSKNERRDAANQAVKDSTYGADKLQAKEGFILEALQAQAENQKNTNDLVGLKSTQKQIGMENAKLVDANLKQSLAEFERTVAESPPPFSDHIKGILANPNHIGRASKLTDDTNGVFDALQSDEQRASFNKLADAMRARLHQAEEVKVQDYDLEHQISEKNISAEESNLRIRLAEINRRIEQARKTQTLSQEAEALANERFAIEQELIGREKAKMESQHQDPAHQAEILHSMGLAADTNRKNLIEEGGSVGWRKLNKDFEIRTEQINQAIKFAVAAGDSQELLKLQAERLEIVKESLAAEKKRLILDGRFETDLAKETFIPTGILNNENKNYAEFISMLGNQSAQAHAAYDANFKTSVFGYDGGGYRKGANIVDTLGQQSSVVHSNLATALIQHNSIAGTLGVAQSGLDSAIKAGNKESIHQLTQEVEKLQKDLNTAKTLVGEFRGQLSLLDATFLSSIQAVTGSNILAKFQELNSGFNNLRDQVETNLAGMMDGLTGVLGNFIGHGFNAVQDLQALRDAIGNTASATLSYQQTVSNRIGMIQEIQSSPTILKESQAVQTLIINQASTAQLAAEAAARQQLAIAKLQEAQVRRENSLGGQIQIFMTNAAKDFGATLLKDTLGQGIKSIFSTLMPGIPGLSDQKMQFTPDGRLKVDTGVGGVVSDLVGSNKSSNTPSLWDKISNGASSAWDTVSGWGSSALSSIGGLFGMSPAPAAGSGLSSEISSSIGGLFGMSPAPAAGSGLSSEISSALGGSKGGSLASSLESSFNGFLGKTNSGGLGSTLTSMFQNFMGSGSGGGAGGGGVGNVFGSILGIVGSLVSIGTTIATYQQSTDAYNAVINAANPAKQPVPTTDPTVGGVVNPVNTGTNYGPLAGYLSADKYQAAVTSAAQVLASGSMAAMLTAPAYAGGVSSPSTGGNITGTQQIVNSNSSSVVHSQPSAPNVNIVNLMDGSVVGNYLSGSAGTKVILNTIKSNSTAIKQSLRD